MVQTPGLCKFVVDISSPIQCLVTGLVLATFMYLVEMTLYILRAIKLENAAQQMSTGMDGKLTAELPHPDLR
jgi:hypothetical protein